MLDYCTSPRSLSAILSYMGYSNRSKFRNKYITPMIDEGKLKMTIPDHPNSRFQQYLAISEKSNKTDNGYNK
ncbi:Fic family protein [Segatella cerevisiae]|uniref:Fic family protein n=1 Tax=Segatella cerevisiae TaxID=2053716 RepID=UPI00374D41FA